MDSRRLALPPNVITDRSKIIGRVMNHEKGPGYVFTEADFMPVGTRFGVVAGIPPGKRSFTVEASKISGIHGLQLGDRFDLVGTLPVDKNQPAQQRIVRATDGLTPPEPEVARAGQQRHDRLAAADAGGHLYKPVADVRCPDDVQAGRGSGDCLGSGRNSRSDRRHDARSYHCPGGP